MLRCGPTTWRHGRLEATADVLCGVILGNVSSADSEAPVAGRLGSSSSPGTGTIEVGASELESASSSVLGDDVGRSQAAAPSPRPTQGPLPVAPTWTQTRSRPGSRQRWQSSDGPLTVRFSYGTTTTGGSLCDAQWWSCNATVSSPPCLQLYQAALDNVVLCSNDPQYLTVSSSGTSLDFAYMVRWAALSALLTLLLVLLLCTVSMRVLRLVCSSLCVYHLSAWLGVWWSRDAVMAID